MEPDSPVLPQALAERIRQALGRRAQEDGPEQAEAVARTAFAEAFGGEPARVAVVHGYVPIIAEHTHYFPGFGLLTRLPWTVAAAARPSGGAGRMIALTPDPTLVARLGEALFSQAGVAAEGGEVVVISGSAWVDEGAGVGAAAVALLRAHGMEDDVEIAKLAAAAGQEALGRPYGPAYALAGCNGDPVVLIDGGTGEHLAVTCPSDLGFGLIDLGGKGPPPEALWERAALVENALTRLQDHGFAGLTSLRRLEHQDLPDALAALPGPARPLVRHLASEDRRVPRLVAALKRADSQVLGALLLMSQASRRDDEGVSNKAVEAVVEAVGEAEGVYGARMGGVGGGLVLVAGRAFLLPTFLDTVAGQIEARFGYRPDTIVL